MHGLLSLYHSDDWNKPQLFQPPGTDYTVQRHHHANLFMWSFFFFFQFEH